MKKIGFFGGTFDPIHFGHLFLALQLAESAKLDEVWVCPAFCSPFKQECCPEASAMHRLEMARLAVADVSGFKVLSLEVDLQKTSYTIDTIQALPPAEYHLLLSEESASTFLKWKNPELLARLAPPLIGCRGGLQALESQENTWREISFLQQGIIPTRRMEISSTEIRKRLKNKLYSGHLVPAKALDYIERHQLYFC